MSHTQGSWKLGNLNDSVITTPTEETPRLEILHYGGKVIAESIMSDADRYLISAAPEMFEACKKAYEALEAINGFCGQNLQVHGWHLNGDPEEFDNFINENLDGNEMELLYKAILKAKGEFINE
jgi:hypothetical protein